MSAGSASWLSGVLSRAISSAMFVIVLLLNTNDFQYWPSGLVGSKTRWNHVCASANRWLLLRWTAIITGMWYSSSQL